MRRLRGPSQGNRRGQAGGGGDWDSAAGYAWLFSRGISAAILALNGPAASLKGLVLRAVGVAPWELRIGGLRAYYEVKDDPERVVVVKAVGVKDRNRVRIGGEEVEL